MHSFCIKSVAFGKLPYSNSVAKPGMRKRETAA